MEDIPKKTTIPQKDPHADINKGFLEDCKSVYAQGTYSRESSEETIEEPVPDFILASS